MLKYILAAGTVLGSLTKCFLTSLSFSLCNLLVNLLQHLLNDGISQKIFPLADDKQCLLYFYQGL